MPRPRKTRCVHGHEYTEQNTRVDNSGRRRCRACDRRRKAGLRTVPADVSRWEGRGIELRDKAKEVIRLLLNNHIRGGTLSQRGIAGKASCGQPYVSRLNTALCKLAKTKNGDFEAAAEYLLDYPEGIAAALLKHGAG